MIEIKLTRRSLSDRIRYISDKYGKNAPDVMMMLGIIADDVDELVKSLEFALQLSQDIEHAERCGSMNEPDNNCDDFPLDDPGCYKDGDLNKSPCPWISIKRTLANVKGRT